MKRFRQFIAIVLIMLFVFTCSACGSPKPSKVYDNAQTQLAQGNYEKAAELFDSISSYEDSSKMSMYSKALAYGESGKYDDAISALTILEDFKDSSYLITYYTICKLAYGGGTKNYPYPYNMIEAAEEFDTISVFRDSANKAEECRNTAYNVAVEYFKDKAYEPAQTLFWNLNGYKDSAAQIEACQTAIKDNKYDAAVALMSDGKYTEAITAFQSLNGYKDSAAQIEACQNAILEDKYQQAIALNMAGKYEEAYAAFSAISGYKDVDNILKTDKNIAAVEHAIYVAQFDVGKTVKFGNYEQDNNTANGKEEIEWLVLAREDNKALLISKYALDCQPYNSEFTDTTWEKCTLRAWLNGTFLNTAFSFNEQKKILTTTVKAGENIWMYNADPGNNTQDKIFLLSQRELDDFSSYLYQHCETTAYAYARGAEYSCDWWLRSPGMSNTMAATSENYGRSATSVDGFDIGVRPVLWIDLSF